MVVNGVPAFREGMIDIDEFAIPITVPSGAEIMDGETLTIRAKDDLDGSNLIQITFTTVSIGAAIEVIYTTADTPTEIAQKLYDALPLPLQGYIFSPREVYLLNASSVATLPGSAFVSFQIAPERFRCRSTR